MYLRILLHRMLLFKRRTKRKSQFYLHLLPRCREKLWFHSAFAAPRECKPCYFAATQEEVSFLKDWTEVSFKRPLVVSAEDKAVPVDTMGVNAEKSEDTTPQTKPPLSPSSINPIISETFETEIKLK